MPERRRWGTKPVRSIICAAALALCLALLSACSGGGTGGASSASATARPAGAGGSSASRPELRRATRTSVLSPDASGEVVYGEGSVAIDASHTAQGYFMLRYSGSADKVRLQLTVPDGTTYSNIVQDGGWHAFPLPGGDGHYHIDVLEHAYDQMYAFLSSADLDVKLEDPFGPFLYPNQYVWYTAGSRAVSLGRQLSDESSSDLDYVSRVYHYVIDNITYDQATADVAQFGYVPDIDATLQSGKGICFDYAALMAAMLRSQGVPTKLVIGYSGQVNHAWISVYLEESGWVDNIIQFNGKSWSMMDPTLAANNRGAKTALKEYIGDGSNYTVKYTY